MSTVRVTYSAAEGAVVWGTRRGDGSADVLKRHGFRWSGSLGAWYLRNSRDGGTFPEGLQGLLDRLARLAGELQAAGLAAELRLDATPRSTAEREADRAERLDGRAERLSARAGRLSAAAAADHDRARAMGDAIPFGQPILVGHHSEGRDRNYRARMARTMDRAVETGREAEETARRAQASTAGQRHRLSAGATLRRIAKIEAELRGLERRRQDHEDRAAVAAMGLAGPVPVVAERTLDAQRRASEEELAYWRDHLAQLEAAGVKLWGPDDFRPGDRVNGSATVLRVNRKSVTVRHDVWAVTGLTHTLPYDDVRSMQRPEGDT